MQDSWQFQSQTVWSDAGRAGIWFSLLCGLLVGFTSFTIGLSLYAAQSQDNCLLTKNGAGLPPFPDRGYPEATPGSRIHHRNQAIIPSYKLNCCGNITEWGVDLNPDGTSARFNFVFQVWRPAPDVNVSGCYSLVDDFISTGIPIEIQPTPVSYTHLTLPTKRIV